jgi:UDP-2,4-diacetamido-2,4,6-trideoxy-beta-L-altropyranose hydrolase
MGEVKQKILFRADGNAAIGLGHIYRSCTLAQIVGDSFVTEFFVRNPSAALKQEIEACSQLITVLNEGADKETEIDILVGRAGSNDIIVLDGYHFDEQYRSLLKSKTTAAIVCIDDIHRGQYDVDAVINHIGGIYTSEYTAPVETLFFLGTEYALVKRIFLNTQPDWQGNDLLICLGGADPENRTLEILSELPQRFKQINVIIGSAYRYKKELTLFTAGKNVIVHENLSPYSMANLMASCKYAVLSPSTVCYEYMHIGGVVYLYQIAGNQQKVKEFFLEQKLAFDFEQIRNKSEYEEEVMVNQKKHFDQKSHDRLLKVFEGLYLVKTCIIRKASEADVEITWQWASDPLTRSMSYNAEPIAFEVHASWFRNKLEQKNVHYFIFEHERVPVAQIRFETQGNEALLSYSIAKDFRGKSLGAWVLSKGIKALKTQEPLLQTVVGFVKEMNVASIKSFEKLAFKKEEAPEHPGSFKYSIAI